MSSVQELRDSIAASGCIEELLQWGGLLIDGRERYAICVELGLVPRIRFVHSLEQACSALFLKHPERAVALAREHLGGHVGLPPTLLELARVCGTNVSRVARVVKPAAKNPKRGPRRSHADRSIRLNVWVEPQWRHYVRLAGAAHGMSLSATIRHACWVFVQETLSRKPTEGTDRSPSPHMVKKPERRLLKR